MGDQASHSEEDMQAGPGGGAGIHGIPHTGRGGPLHPGPPLSNSASRSLSQGFHRGAAPLHCYNLKEFVEAVSKREFNNPAGGVRSLDFDLVVPWLRDVIGDQELARAVQAIAKDARNMAEAVDRTRLTAFVRVNQYNEVLKDVAE